MDIASTTISNIAVAAYPHAAQEARRDSLAKAAIPQIDQTSKQLNSQASGQGSAQLAPANANLYIQADSMLKVDAERRSQNTRKNQKSAKREGTETVSEDKSTTAAKAGAQSAVASSSVSGQSLDGNITAASKVNAALGGSYGGNGASYSADAESKREKGEGYSSKVIASTYNGIAPSYTLGRSLDVLG